MFLRYKVFNSFSYNCNCNILYFLYDFRSYYFSLEYLNELFTKTGYAVINSSYIHRRTVNKKENIDLPRIFVQGKFRKPVNS